MIDDKVELTKPFVIKYPFILGIIENSDFIFKIDLRTELNSEYDSFPFHISNYFHKLALVYDLGYDHLQLKLIDIQSLDKNFRIG